ncbi:MAG TPA: InlB B-repeat-containing protein, partial [Methanocorpusculum sp.]|nr:InlB B-repeat-containing protein [Methanocorpusculum sp.]HJK31009.1 InlB B-repeat-containing protein [Methanocorpusculum sp.]
MMKTRLNGTERPKKDAGGLRHGLLVLAVLLLTCVLMAGAVSASEAIVSDYDELVANLSTAGVEKITLEEDIVTNEEIVVERAVTIDGNGHKISAGAAIGDHLLEIRKVDGLVTLENLTLDSDDKAKGLNIHEPGQEITLTNLTLTNSTGSGITINGANVIASDLTISESGWNQSIDVGISAKPLVDESTLTLRGTNNLQDIYQINSDNPDNVTVTVDGYTTYDWYYWYMDGDNFKEYDNYKRTWTTNSDFATKVDIPKVQGSKAAVWVYDTDSKVYALHQDIGNATTYFKAGDSVKQLQNINVDAPITIDEAITFDGNEKTISGESTTGYFLMVAVPRDGNEGESVILQNLNLDISSIGGSANLGGITVRANADNDESVPVTLKDSIVDMSEAGMTSTSMNPAVYFVNAPNSQITNNEITAGAASSSSTRCVVVDGGSDVTVSDNILTLGSVSDTAVAVGVEIKGNDVDKVTVSGNTLNPGTNPGDTPRAVKITAKDTGSQKTFTVSKNDIQFGGIGTTVEVLLSTYKISDAADAQVKLNVEENTGSTASVVMLNKGNANGNEILLTSTITLTGNIYNPALTSPEEVAVVGGFAEDGSEKPNTDGVTRVNPAPQPVYSSGGNMANAYRVLFNDGSTTLTVQTDLSSGDKLTKPETPVKDGYTFAGWYKDSACTQAWDFETGISGDMTLYAKWTAAGSSGETEATATPTKTATAVTTPQPTKTQTAAATTSAPEATTAAGVSP